MSNEHLEVMLDGVRLRFLRSRILIALDCAYPERLDKKMLFSHFEKQTELRTIERELHYLTDKRLITLDSPVEEMLWARITARGRDFLTGDVEEVGIAPRSEA